MTTPRTIRGRGWVYPLSLSRHKTNGGMMPIVWHFKCPGTIAVRWTITPVKRGKRKAKQ